jgi:hypothetical protein
LPSLATALTCGLVVGRLVGVELDGASAGPDLLLFAVHAGVNTYTVT